MSGKFGETWDIYLSIGAWFRFFLHLTLTYERKVWQNLGYIAVSNTTIRLFIISKWLCPWLIYKFTDLMFGCLDIIRTHHQSID